MKIAEVFVSVKRGSMSASAPLLPPLEALCDLLLESALAPEAHAALLQFVALCITEHRRSNGIDKSSGRAQRWRRSRL